jgi:ABC-2 type transport system permease protein
MSNPAGGVIHDIGYQRYSGPRSGRAYATRSLYSHGLRTAFGLGRSAKAKIFPWLVVAIVGLIAVVATAVRALGGGFLGYFGFIDVAAFLAVLFCAVAGPELVSRDLRSGVLPLYFSRPLTRRDYALAKWAALVTAVWLLFAGPQLIIFLGGAFSGGTFKDFLHELGQFGQGLSYAAIVALLFASIGVLVGSLSGRRAVAAAIIAGFFLLSSAVASIMLGLGYGIGSRGLSRSSLLFSPHTLVQGVQSWLYDRPLVQFGDSFTTGSIGSFGRVYALAWLVFTAGSVLLLMVRYKKVAR